jgi:FixJ family two-component response regulator
MASHNDSTSQIPAPAAGTVFLVDDDPAVRRALVRLLRSEGFAVASFAAAEDFLVRASPESAPCCLVVDLRMPGLSGLDLQDLMQQEGFDMPVIFISGRSDLGSGIRAMKGGAIDFIEKPVSDVVLFGAVKQALEQHRERRRELALRQVLEARFKVLTPREREVFGLVVTGLLNKQVGAELGAAEKTIKAHRARVMQKMEAGSLAELVRMADKLGQSGPATR